MNVSENQKAPPAQINAQLVDNLRTALKSAEAGQMIEGVLIGVGPIGWHYSFNIAPEDFPIFVGELKIFTDWLSSQVIAARAIANENKPKILRPGRVGLNS